MKGKDQKDISNKTVVMLLFATLAITLGGLFVSFSVINSRLVNIGLTPITGWALQQNGTTTLTVQQTASIRFTADTVAFGTGSVNGSLGSNCTLSTLSSAYGGNSVCTGFNELGNGFTVENDGNTNLTVELYSNVTAATFLGLGSARFLWNVTVNETGSCVNATGTRGLVQPNTSGGTDCGCVDACDCGAIFESVSTTSKVICPSLLYSDVSDALNIDINITIPADTPTGSKLAGFTVIGTTET